VASALFSSAQRSADSDRIRQDKVTEAEARDRASVISVLRDIKKALSKKGSSLGKAALSALAAIIGKITGFKLPELSSILTFILKHIPGGRFARPVFEFLAKHPSIGGILGAAGGTAVTLFSKVGSLLGRAKDAVVSPITNRLEKFKATPRPGAVSSESGGLISRGIKKAGAFGGKVLSGAGKILSVLGPLGELLLAFQAGWDIGSLIYETFSTEILDFIDSVVGIYEAGKKNIISWVKEKRNKIADFLSGIPLIPSSIISWVRGEPDSDIAKNDKVDYASSYKVPIEGPRVKKGLVGTEYPSWDNPLAAANQVTTPNSASNSITNNYNSDSGSAFSQIPQGPMPNSFNSGVQPPAISIPTMSYADEGFFLLNCGALQ
jgi:hypothetical protein